jgi:hypothetical protein
MKCLACGAEMRLMDVRTDTSNAPFGIERRIFQCSSCRQIAQRLGFDRSRMTTNAPEVMSNTSAHAIRLQEDHNAHRSIGVLAGEKSNSTIKVAPKPQDAVDWGPVVRKASIALKEQAVAARASAWARTIEKLRKSQMALKEQIGTETTAAAAGYPLSNPGESKYHVLEPS